MRAAVFIGDPLTATGYRLAGVEVRNPEPREAWQCLAEACREAPMVLIAAETAAQLPQDRLEHLLCAESPLILIVPDAGSRIRPPDLVREVHRALGVET